MAKCEECGSRYNKADVSERILDLCGIWSEQNLGGLCFDCALIKYVEDTVNNSYADQEEDYDNSGCVTCGNLAFPDCMDSCPMLDY